MSVTVEVSECKLLETDIWKTGAENPRETMTEEDSGGPGVAGRWRSHFLGGKEARLSKNVGMNSDTKSSQLRCPVQEAPVTCCGIRCLGAVRMNRGQRCIMCGNHCFSKCNVFSGTTEIRMPSTNNLVLLMTREHADRMSHREI